tara:strand:+ start:831 stop:1115 length:285 start_codon:yes stop_codon:yes gene_type:complete
MGIFKDHIDYLKDNPEGYWFKRKLYGWGWTPARWQGWAITLLYMATIIYIAFTEPDPRVFLVDFAIVTILFLVIVVRTGQKPKWQWGKKDNEEE